MILAFDIWALYGTWGTTSLTSSNTARRETQLYPGKASIVGLLGAAAGWGREELGEMARLLSVATRTDAQPLRDSKPDYESTRRVLVAQSDMTMPPATRFEELRALLRKNGGKAAGSILSTREYWVAGGWTAFVSSPDERLLEGLCKSLKAPRWQLYAGRTCCPLCFPVAPLLLEADDLARAADMHPGLQHRLDGLLAVSLKDWRLVRRGMLTWEDGFPCSLPAVTRKTTRQQPLPVPGESNEPRHTVRLFGHLVECSAPQPNRTSAP